MKKLYFISSHQIFLKSNKILQISKRIRKKHVNLRMSFKLNISLFAKLIKLCQLLEMKKYFFLCSGYFLQAPPIQQSEYHTDNLNPFAPKPTVTEERLPFALFLSTMRHITIPRYTVNQKIVVVGASNVATSFLLSLISAVTPYYKIIFTNVTLVSPHSISLAQNELRDRLFVAKSNRNCRSMNMTSLRTYINLVFGAMTKIDRAQKRITINDCCYLYYDYLFLFCGEQYQGPNVEALMPLTDDKETRKKPTNFGMPKNVFIINTELDAHHALSQLKSLIHSQKKKLKCEYKKKLS